MKNFILIRYIIPLLMLIAVAGGCKEDSDEPLPDVVYSLEVDGNDVAFKNETEGENSYKWDFGDDATSTEENPVHTYPGKGKYVATLYVTTPAGKVLEGSTVIRISKTTPVKLNDNSLADWDDITANVITPTGAGNAIKTVKLDYDGNMVYIYLEMTGRRSDGPIFDFYLDTDNNSTTGLLTNSYPEGGYDVLMEGQILSDWFDVFYHTGAQSSFTFDQQSISEPYKVGTVAEQNGLLKFECGLVRSKLKNLTGTGLRIAIVATKSDWSATLGSAPNEGVAGYLLDMNE